MERRRASPGPAALVLCCLLALWSPACAAAAGSRRSLLQTATGALQAALSTPPAPGSPPATVPAATNAPPPLDCCAQLAAIGFASGLPVVVLDTAGKNLTVKDVVAPVRFCTCSNGAYADYDGLADAKVRGSTSATATKKSFDVQLQSRTQAGKKEKFGLLGMPADSDWILYGGDEVDLTLGMRNWLAYGLYRDAGRYAPRTVWVETFLVNDSSTALAMSHYIGSYIALEKLKIAPNRVNVSDLTPPDLSGGYLFVYDNDNIDAGDVTFGQLPGWQHPFILKDPKKAPAEAKDWLTNYLGSFQEALEAPDWLSRSPAYTTLIDGPAWVDYFLLVELTKNPDGYRGSTYLYKDRGAPLAAGPPWDYNEAFGICWGYPITGWDQQGVSGPGQSGGSAISPDGWRFNVCADASRCTIDPTDGLSRWYRRMWEDPLFRGGAAQRWAQLRAGPWSDAAIAGRISELTAKIKPAAVRNYVRYTWVLVKPWMQGSVEQIWGNEVATLQSWLLQHMAWMDGAFAAAASGSAQVTAAAGP